MEKKVFFLNHSGSGFADFVTVANDCTLMGLLTLKMGQSFNPSAFFIRVNKQMVDPNYVLAEGDRVSVTPTKITGA